MTKQQQNALLLCSCKRESSKEVRSQVSLQLSTGRRHWCLHPVTLSQAHQGHMHTSACAMTLLLVLFWYEEACSHMKVFTIKFAVIVGGFFLEGGGSLDNQVKRLLHFYSWYIPIWAVGIILITFDTTVAVISAESSSTCSSLSGFIYTS